MAGTEGQNHARPDPRTGQVPVPAADPIAGRNALDPDPAKRQSL